MDRSEELTHALDVVQAAVEAHGFMRTADAFKLVQAALERSADLGDSHDCGDAGQLASLDYDCKHLLERVGRWYWDMVRAQPHVEDGFERKLTLRGGYVGYDANDRPLFEVRVKEVIDEENF